MLIDNLALKLPSSHAHCDGPNSRRLATRQAHERRGVHAVEELGQGKLPKSITHPALLGPAASHARWAFYKLSTPLRQTAATNSHAPRRPVLGSTTPSLPLSLFAQSGF